MHLKPLCSLGLALIFSAVAVPTPTPAADAAKDAAARIKHVEAAGAAQLLKDNPEVVILDLRTPAEFDSGHIKGAQNVDFNADSFRKRVHQLEKDKVYLVHCASGGRSTKSLELFKLLNFNSVYHLDGGIKGWEKARLPVEKKPEKK